MNGGGATRRAERIFGAGHIDALVPGDAALTVVPWQRAGRRRDRAMVDQALVDALLAQPPYAHLFAELDPRELYATQPYVLRAGVTYYLTDRYRISGRTYADRNKVGNTYPVVYRRDGQDLILSGHHRAAEALLQGRPLRARLVEGPWGATRSDGPVSLTRPGRHARPETVGGATRVTPSLIAGGDIPALPGILSCRTAEQAAAVICGGGTAALPGEDFESLALAVLQALGVHEQWAARQVRYARTGRLTAWADPASEEGHTP